MPNITGIVCFIVLYFIDLSKSFLLQIEGDFCLCFFLIFIGVQLIYNIVLLSAIQHSESAVHVHISTLS